jgi:hypothetical protein
MLLAMATFWLLIPLIDWVWYKYKFPKTFGGSNVWTGKWTSAMHSGAHGRLNAIFPKEYNNTGSFTADALLYSSIRSTNTPGKFRTVSITGTIEQNATGKAMVASTPNIDTLEVTYNALVSNDSKQIAGGYKDPGDIGTFWIRKEPF